MVYILGSWRQDPPALTKEQVKQIKTATRATLYLLDGESYLQLPAACGHDYCDDHAIKIPAFASLDDYSDSGAERPESHGIAAYYCHAGPSATEPTINRQWGAFLHALRAGDKLVLSWIADTCSSWSRSKGIFEDRAAIGIYREREGKMPLRLDYAVQERLSDGTFRLCQYDARKEMRCQTCRDVIDATRGEDRCYSCQHPQNVTDGLAAAVAEGSV